MKKQVLGRGLDALLPQSDEQGQILEISVADIDVNAEQPRKDFDEETLRELAASIAQVGLLQPILVIRQDDRYRIVAGERRLRAAKMAGLRQIPCILREFSETEQLVASLIENLQREDLNPIEEALAVRALMDACGLTQEQAAVRLGKSRPAVANLLRLLSLPETVQELLRGGLISGGHARVLAGLQDARRQQQLAGRVVTEGLSVRELERLCASESAKPRRQKPTEAVPLELKDFEDRLRETIGLRASVRGNLSRGRIILSYRSKEELDYAYSAIEKLL